MERESTSQLLQTHTHTKYKVGKWKKSYINQVNRKTSFIKTVSTAMQHTYLYNEEKLWNKSNDHSRDSVNVFVCVQCAVCALDKMQCVCA